MKRVAGVLEWNVPLASANSTSLLLLVAALVSIITHTAEVANKYVIYL